MRAIACLAATVAVAGCYGSSLYGHADGGQDDGAADGIDVPADSPDTAADAPPDVPGDTGTDAPGDGVDVPWDVEPPPGTCPAGWTCRVSTLPTFNGVDILVVVDNSRSMTEEQATMREQFPIMIRNLLDPGPTHTPITDVHIGVVSTDMGTGGYTVETCEDPIDGDDGILMHAPSPEVPGCDPAYPAYLSYEVDSPDPVQVDWMSTAFGCIATLGSRGCGFEQQLEASLKALTVHSAPGGPNAGFLRDDTVLLVMWLTDEEDCSVADPAIFNLSDPTLGHLNLRCYMYPYMVHHVDRYVDGLLGLRAGSVWPVIMGMIVGVPPEEKECNGFGDQIGNCLDMPLMQEVIDPVDPTRLQYSCNTDRGVAYPPRRFVELALAAGPRAYVHSICQGDYTPALAALSRVLVAYADLTCDAAIVDLAEGPTGDCGCSTACQVVHVLDAGSPCPPGTSPWDHDRDGSFDAIVDASGNPVVACEVPYAGTLRGDCGAGCLDPYQSYSPAGAGWYYSLSYTGVACPSISYTDGYGTPAGASSFVACP